MRYIERTQYLDRLKRLRGTPDIKIITGVRRSGKSELLKSYLEYLKNDSKDVNIIYIDFSDYNYNNLKTCDALHNYVESRYIQGAENILIIDEVQLCKDFEIVINSFHNSKKYDIYITGSNAFLLSSELATLFTGRFIQIPIFPFSFAEYCKYFDIKDNYTSHLRDYVRYGGLSGSYVYEDQQDRRGYILDLYTTLIKRDLIDKYNITQVELLDTLVQFLMDNISNLTSVNNIKNATTNPTAETNHVTIGNYIKYLCNAFMFYKVKRYDIKGKKYLSTKDKYYLVDTSLRYSLLGERNMDYGRAYENIVAIELLRRGYDTYVGKLYQKEIDFIAMKGTEKYYIQVADSITDKNTLSRELEPLFSIRDAYPKIILANTNNPRYDIAGVKVIDISEWLLSTF